MKNKKVVLITVFLSLVVIIIGFIAFLPLFEFDNNGKLIMFRYKEDYTEFEDNMCYSESYSYNEERDISIYSWDFKRVLFFYMVTLEYKEGNVCETEYLLEESYIEDFINNAEIKYNNDNIDLAELIKDRRAIVGNTKYFGNDYNISISYVLDGKHEEMFIFYKDDLLIIQVGLSDEGPKFIAYEKVEKYSFMDVDWIRDASGDIETLKLSSDGKFSYYCSCGNPVDDSDLCEGYYYDVETNTIKLNCEKVPSDAIFNIKIVSYDDKNLVLDFDGEIRTFERE